MKKLWNLFLILGLLIIWGTATGQAPEKKQHTFVGVDKCKMCHKKAKTGEQYPIWKKSKHAEAYKTLASDAAKKIAEERGIENPQEAAECLKCHVTGYGVDKKFLDKKYKIEDGVGCESCHGAGGDYYKKKTMQAIADGKIEAASVGLVVPDKKVCIGCHNSESPAYKEFKFDEFVKKIAHLIPDSKK